jgi:purine nucleosidase
MVDAMPEDSVPIVYDTDLGEDIDDLYALYLALFHPRIEVLAVTTVHGDTVAKARLAKKVLRMAGRPEIPVGAGIGMSEARIARGQTLPDPNRSASYIRYVGPDDAESGDVFPTAAEVISKVVSDSDDQVTLVGEGAFSNIAQAVCDTSLREKIRCVALMGGETQAVWNEYNVLCDPEAADVVFTCGLPVFMGTFFLTARLVMTMDEVAEHFGDRSTPVLQVLADCTDLWKPHCRHKPGPVLYDLVPVFWLADESCVKTRRSLIRVELEGAYTRGQTVRFGDEEGPVLESLDLNPKEMVGQFIELMKRARRR